MGEVAPTGRRGVHLAWLVVGGLLAALYGAHAVAYGVWEVDDAGITFAYARNLAEGHGLVTNPGDPLPNEGFSNPAWTFLLAAFMAVGAFDLVWTPKLLSGAAALGTFAAAAWIVRQLNGGARSWREAVPALALTANGSWVAWTMGGLENAQYVFSILLALALYLRDVSDRARWPVSGPAFFLVAISRPEGLVYTVAVGVEALVRAALARDGRWLLRLVAGVAAPLGVYLVWHVAYFDDVLPNTYYAKSRDMPFLERLTNPRAGGWRYLLDGLSRWFQAPLLLLGALAVLDRQVWRRGGAALGLVGAASVLFVLQSNGDWMMQFRFASPTFAAIALLAAVGLGTVQAGLLPGPRWARVTGALALAGVSVGAVAAQLPSELEDMRANPTVPLQDRLTRLPRLLEVADGLGIAHPVILMSDMGGPMWVNRDGRSTLVDMFGLCTREIAHALHDRDLAAMWRLGFHEANPDFVQVPPTLYRQWRLDALTVWQDAYMPLDDWRQADADTGFFLRRDRVQAPWDDAFAQGTMVVQRPVRVHAVRVVDTAPVTVTVDFSLRTETRITPRARIVVMGDRPLDAVVDLLPSLPPRALAPDVVYRAQVVVPVPEDLGPVVGAAAVGTPERSDLRPPPVWERVDLGWTGTDLPEDLAVGAEGDAVRGEDGAIVFAPADDDNRLCTPAAVPGRAMRLVAHLALPTLDGQVDLDVRWFDGTGRFLERARVWSWTQPSPELQAITLAVAPVPEAGFVRACWHVSEGTGEVRLADVGWLRQR